MKRLFDKIYSFLRNHLLEDVDKRSDEIPKYHRGFLSKKDPTTRLNERFKQQKRQNRIN